MKNSDSQVRRISSNSQDTPLTTTPSADTPSNVSDELYTELRRYFSEEQLIDLAASAAQENLRARWNRVFDVGSDGQYRRGLRFKQCRVA